MEELISVLMTTYNEKTEWIKESLDSLIAQTYTNIEIIIVVDKPDETSIINLLREYERNYKQIKVIINKNNIGLASSLNKAFEISTGMYIARMDADDISESNRLEKQIKLLKENPRAQLISTRCKYIDEEGLLLGEQSIKYKSYFQINRGLKYINFLIHPSWLMRRKVFLQLNGYREFECSQDYDFLLRMVSNNLNIMLCDEYLIRYRVRTNSLSSSRGFKQYLIAKYIRFLYKERLKTGKDSFSIENLNSFLRKNKYQEKINDYNNYSKRFMDLRAANTKFQKLKQAIQCMVVSKYSRNLLVNSILFKINTKI